MLGRAVLFLVGVLLTLMAGAPTAAVAAPSEATVEKAADEHGESEAKIRAILADKTTRVDKEGRIYYVDPAPAVGLPAPVENGPYPYEQTFQLHSRPGSNRVIYLDFDGETITGTAWNDSRGMPPFYAEPFSLDGDACHLQQRRAGRHPVGVAARGRGLRTVRRRRDDAGPGRCGHQPRRTSPTCSSAHVRSSPTRRRSPSTCELRRHRLPRGFRLRRRVRRMPITSQPSCSPRTSATATKNIAEAASHEVGHNLDLAHDGTATAAYYTGTRRVGADHGRRLLLAGRAVEQGRVRGREQHPGPTSRGSPPTARRCSPTTLATPPRGRSIRVPDPR